jgi:hypothetical protein
MGSENFSEQMLSDLLTRYARGERCFAGVEWVDVDMRAANLAQVNLWSANLAYAGCERVNLVGQIGGRWILVGRICEGRICEGRIYEGRIYGGRI